MNLEELKRKISALSDEQRRHLAAFIVSLHDAEDSHYRERLANKIDKPASEFAKLQEMDRRLNLTDDSQ